MERPEYVVLVRDVEALINKELRQFDEKLTSDFFSDQVEYAKVFASRKTMYNLLVSFQRFAAKAQIEEN